MPTFAATLSAALRATGTSQYRLWKDSGLDHSYISRLVRGERQPTRASVERIGAALGCDSTTTAHLLEAAGFSATAARGVPPDPLILRLEATLHNMQPAEATRLRASVAQLLDAEHV
jgi:cyanate lyase